MPRKDHFALNGKCGSGHYSKVHYFATSVTFSISNSSSQLFCSLIVSSATSCISDNLFQVSVPSSYFFLPKYLFPQHPITNNLSGSFSFNYLFDAESIDGRQCILRLYRPSALPSDPPVSPDSSSGQGVCLSSSCQSETFRQCHIRTSQNQQELHDSKADRVGNAFKYRNFLIQN